jgi:hypothetical protein
MIDLGQRSEPYEIALPLRPGGNREAAHHRRYGSSAGDGPARSRGD